MSTVRDMIERDFGYRNLGDYLRQNPTAVIRTGTLVICFNPRIVSRLGAMATIHYIRRDKVGYLATIRYADDAIGEHDADDLDLLPE